MRWRFVNGNAGLQNTPCVPRTFVGPCHPYDKRYDRMLQPYSGHSSAPGTNRFDKKMPGSANRPRSSHATSLLSSGCWMHPTGQRLVEADRAPSDALISVRVRDRYGDFRIRCNHRSVLDGAIDGRRSGRRFALRRRNHPPFSLLRCADVYIKRCNTQSVDHIHLKYFARTFGETGALAEIRHRNERGRKRPAGGEQDEDDRRQRHIGRGWMNRT